LAPFTSTPIMGTKAKKKREIINKGTANVINISVLIAEIIIMIDKDKKVKVRCLVKKK